MQLLGPSSSPNKYIAGNRFKLDISPILAAAKNFKLGYVDFVITRIRARHSSRSQLFAVETPSNQFKLQRLSRT